MTIFLNLTLLAVTAFIPFATSTLGTYPDMRSTTFLYGSAAYRLRNCLQPDADAPGPERRIRSACKHIDYPQHSHCL